MGSSAKKSKKSGKKVKRGKKAEAAAASVDEAPTPAILEPLGLSIFSAVLSFLAFPGFDVWPLAFVCLVPLFFALDWSPRLTNKQAIICSIAFGFTGMWGGYYWVVTMLQDFSGFPLIVCILFASLLNLAQGGMLALMAWLYWRLRGRGWWPILAAPAAHAASELVYPMLFPYYYANHLHDLPIFIQIADLGGPLLVTAFVSTFNVGLYLLLRSVVKKSPLPRRQLAIAAAATIFTVGYGAYRMHEVDARAAAAPAITVGMPQVSMGIFEKREDPWRGLEMHIEMSRELEREVSPDLLVWPESAFTFFLPDGATNVRDQVMGPLRTPLLFGGLQRRQEDGREKHYNTAFILDADGNIEGTYDKTYLLAFGEYLPLGEQFPVFYEWSPHSGRFTPGSHVRPLPFRDYRITTMVCYEDIIPSFVRHAVNEANPHLLVNITNDAWFGDTTEPWEHLALAKFRAVEHHRYFVRSTNSGVSAIIDPAGRVLGNTGVFTEETLSGEVRMMTSTTVYQYLGDWPGWLALAACIWLGWFRRRDPQTGAIAK
jgi:apolipoprotein N-acyltransferase